MAVSFSDNCDGLNADKRERTNEESVCETVAGLSKAEEDDEEDEDDNDVDSVDEEGGNTCRCGIEGEENPTLGGITSEV